MTAHKHAEMIKAKVDNMDLVVFMQQAEAGCKDFMVSNLNGMVNYPQYNYFLCLPEHNENGQCLHWLNGGNVLASRFDNQMPFTGVLIDSAEVDLEDDASSYPWRVNHVFMDEAQTISIKPRKENRWIGYHQGTNQTFPHPQKSREVAEDYAARNYGYPIKNWQFIEIEVEVPYD